MTGVSPFEAFHLGYNLIACVNGAMWRKGHNDL